MDKGTVGKARPAHPPAPPQVVHLRPVDSFSWIRAVLNQDSGREQKPFQRPGRTPGRLVSSGKEAWMCDL